MKKFKSNFIDNKKSIWSIVLIRIIDGDGSVVRFFEESYIEVGFFR